MPRTTPRTTPTARRRVATDAADASVAATEKHYAVFFSSGSFFSEESRREIASWDPRAAAPLARTVVERYGATPYAFRFETYLERGPVPDGRGGTMEVEPKRIARSGLYFLGGKLVTLDEVEARADPKESILRSNMRSEDSSVVCVNVDSRFRSTHPFEEGDALCDRDGNVLDRGDSDAWKAYRWKVAERIAAEDGLPPPTKLKRGAL